MTGRLIEAIETHLCRVSTEEALLIEDNDVAAIEVDGMRGTETGHCNDISGYSVSRVNGYSRSNLHPPPTTMILGAIVIWVYVRDKREMGNGYDFLGGGRGGEGEASGMWLGFVSPDLSPHKRKVPTVGLPRHSITLPHWGKRGWGSEWVCRFLSADHVTSRTQTAGSTLL